ncbi:hypothetical protein MMC08_000925 [Hypocenomyce scalaris]|nr:hypothetical protein [Hypocenomyce scalaris]
MASLSFKKMESAKGEEGIYASLNKSNKGKITVHDLGLTLLPGSQIQTECEHDLEAAISSKQYGGNGEEQGMRAARGASRAAGEGNDASVSAKWQSVQPEGLAGEFKAEDPVCFGMNSSKRKGGVKIDASTESNSSSQDDVDGLGDDENEERSAHWTARKLSQPHERRRLTEDVALGAGAWGSGGHQMLFRARSNVKDKSLLSGSLQVGIVSGRDHLALHRVAWKPPYLPTSPQPPKSALASTYQARSASIYVIGDSTSGSEPDFEVHTTCPGATVAQKALHLCNSPPRAYFKSAQSSFHRLIAQYRQKYGHQAYGPATSAERRCRSRRPRLASAESPTTSNPDICSLHATSRLRRPSRLNFRGLSSPSKPGPEQKLNRQSFPSLPDQEIFPASQAPNNVQAVTKTLHRSTLRSPSFAVRPSSSKSNGSAELPPYRQRAYSMSDITWIRAACGATLPFEPLKASATTVVKALSDRSFISSNSSSPMSRTRSTSSAMPCGYEYIDESSRNLNPYAGIGSSFGPASSPMGSGLHETPPASFANANAPLYPEALPSDIAKYPNASCGSQYGYNSPYVKQSHGIVVESSSTKTSSNEMSSKYVDSTCVQLHNQTVSPLANTNTLNYTGNQSSYQSPYAMGNQFSTPSSSGHKLSSLPQNPPTPAITSHHSQDFSNPRFYHTAQTLLPDTDAPFPNEVGTQAPPSGYVSYSNVVSPTGADSSDNQTSSPSRISHTPVTSQHQSQMVPQFDAALREIGGNLMLRMYNEDIVNCVIDFIKTFPLPGEKPQPAETLSPQAAAARLAAFWDRGDKFKIERENLKKKVKEWLAINPVSGKTRGQEVKQELTRLKKETAKKGLIIESKNYEIDLWRQKYQKLEELLNMRPLPQPKPATAVIDDQQRRMVSVGNETLMLVPQLTIDPLDKSTTPATVSVSSTTSTSQASSGFPDAAARDTLTAGAVPSKRKRGDWMTGYNPYDKYPKLSLHGQQTPLEQHVLDSPQTMQNQQALNTQLFTRVNQAVSMGHPTNVAAHLPNSTQNSKSVNVSAEGQSEEQRKKEIKNAKRKERYREKKSSGEKATQGAVKAMKKTMQGTSVQQKKVAGGNVGNRDMKAQDEQRAVDERGKAQEFVEKVREEREQATERQSRADEEFFGNDDDCDGESDDESVGNLLAAELDQAVEREEAGEARAGEAIAQTASYDSESGESEEE